MVYKGDIYSSFDAGLLRVHINTELTLAATVTRKDGKLAGSLSQLSDITSLSR